MTINIHKFIPIFFVLLWSTGFIGAKYVLPYSDPFWFLAIRATCTIFVLAVLMLLLSKRVFFDLRSFHQIIIGMLIHGSYLGGVFFAISSGMPAGITAVIVGIQPILTAVVVTSMGQEKLTNRMWIGLALGLTAIAMVIFDSHGMSGDGATILGALAAIISLCGISSGTVLQKRWGSDSPFVMSTMYQFMGAAIVFICMTFLLENQSIEWVMPLILSLAWFVFALSIGAILLLMYMINAGQVSKVSSYFYLVPPVVMLESYFLFDEKIGALGIAGAILAICAILLVNKK